MSDKLVILGCGASSGVPNIENGFGDCNPKQIYNQRFRTSAWLEINGQRILIDISPDFRLQYLNNNLSGIDHILVTHLHADHIFGIDELRSVNRKLKKTLPLYLQSDFRSPITTKFGYAFKNPNEFNDSSKYDSPSIVLHDIEYYQPFQLINQINILPIYQVHGQYSSTGFIFNHKLAYCTDVSCFPDKSLELCKGVETLILGVLQLRSHPAHYCFADSLDVIKFLQPKRVFFTHLSNKLDFDEFSALCSKYSQQLSIELKPCYDGLVIDV